MGRKRTEWSGRVDSNHRPPGPEPDRSIQLSARISCTSHLAENTGALCNVLRLVEGKGMPMLSPSQNYLQRCNLSDALCRSSKRILPYLFRGPFARRFPMSWTGRSPDSPKQSLQNVVSPPPSLCWGVRRQFAGYPQLENKQPEVLERVFGSK